MCECAESAELQLSPGFSISFSRFDNDKMMLVWLRWQKHRIMRLNWRRRKGKSEMKRRKKRVVRIRHSLLFIDWWYPCRCQSTQHTRATSLISNYITDDASDYAMYFVSISISHFPALCEFSTSLPTHRMDSRVPHSFTFSAENQTNSKWWKSENFPSGSSLQLLLPRRIQ